MAQQINVNIRMDKDIKEKADALFNALGFNLTTAVNTFVRQALREQRLPFQPKLLQHPLDDSFEKQKETELETALRKAWIEKLNKTILLSADERLIDLPRSNTMREPINLAD